MPVKSALTGSLDRKAQAPLRRVGFRRDRDGVREMTRNYDVGSSTISEADSVTLAGQRTRLARGVGRAVVRQPFEGRRQSVHQPEAGLDAQSHQVAPYKGTRWPDPERQRPSQAFLGRN
jgi:hypothetical protein